MVYADGPRPSSSARMSAATLRACIGRAGLHPRVEAGGPSGDEEYAVVDDLAARVGLGGKVLLRDPTSGAGSREGLPPGRVVDVAAEEDFLPLRAVVALYDPFCALRRQLLGVHNLEPPRDRHVARDGRLRRRRQAVDLLPHQRKQSLVLRDDRAERVDDRERPAGHPRQDRTQRSDQRRGVLDRLAAPHALALPPPVGLVVAQEHVDRYVEEARPLPVEGQIVGRAEDDGVAAALEPGAVQAHQWQVVGELGRVHEADRAGRSGVGGALASGHALEHGEEAALERAVGVDSARRRR
jgi:hypothetical protein